MKKESKFIFDGSNESEKKIVYGRAILFTLFGLIIFLLYLYFFVGFNAILNVIKEVDPLVYSFYYSLTIAAAFLSLIFFALTWYDLLEGLSIHINFKSVLLYCLIARFVDLLLPTEAVSGEITRLYLASKNRSEEGFIGKLTASLVIHRLLSMTVTLVGLLLGSVYIFFQYQVPSLISNLLVAVSTGTLLTIVFLVFLSVKVEIAAKIVNWLLIVAHKLSKSRLDIEKWRIKSMKSLQAFHSGVSIIRKNSKNLLKPILYTVISWFLHLSTYHTVFYALGFHISLSVSIVVFSISVAVQTIPIGLPVGLVEIVMSTLYSFFNIDLSVSGTATTLIRVVTFWFELFIGYLASQWIGIKMFMKKAY